MAVLRPFLAILLSTTLISFTKLCFRRSFLGAEQVNTLFGSKVMPIQFRPVKHLKMTVWTSALWKTKIHMAKNGQKWSYNCYLRVTFISKHSLCFWKFLTFILSPCHTHVLVTRGLREKEKNCWKIEERILISMVVILIG